MQAEIDRVSKSLVIDLGKVVDRVQSKAIASDAAASEAMPFMTDAFDYASRLGYIASGVPEWQHTPRQMEMLGRFIRAEVAFFAAFMQSLESTSSRLNMYSGSVSGAFWRGFSTSLPSNAQIEWRLGIAEHCEDCLGLASKSPYSKPGRGSNPLPTVPRSGGTKCLNNCRCSLHAGRASLFNQIGVEVLALGAIAIEETSDAAVNAARIYQGFAYSYAYAKRLSSLSPGEGWAAEAVRLRAQIDSMAQAMNHKIRMAVTDAEILAAILLAIESGQEYVSQPSSDLVGKFVTVLTDDTIDRGKVTDVSGGTVVLGGDSERSYQIGVAGRAIIFLENDQ